MKRSHWRYRWTVKRTPSMGGIKAYWSAIEPKQTIWTRLVWKLKNWKIIFWDQCVKAIYHKGYTKWDYKKYTAGRTKEVTIFIIKLAYIFYVFIKLPKKILPFVTKGKAHLLPKGESSNPSRCRPTTFLQTVYKIISCVKQWRRYTHNTPAHT